MAHISAPRRAQSSLNLTPGTLIATRYQLVKPLGQGAHGVVWTAEDRLARTRVAVKLLVARSVDQAVSARVEIASLRRLRLPGVVQLLDEGVANGTVFLVMPLVHGVPFPGTGAAARWENISPTVELLLETLARVHDAGIVHRDLKPANVLVDNAMRPVVLDFGLSLASVFEAENGGRIVGTPAYLAPEQLLAGRIDARADLYAVGAMLYQALAGQLPHNADNVPALLAAKTQAPLPLASLAPATPAEVASVVDALLATSPADRPASAHEALERLHGGRAGSRLGMAQWSHLEEASAAIALERLQGLFVEHDPLSSVREDAARLLHERTSGDPRRVREELDAWVRAGHCRWQMGPNARLVIEREAVDQLETRLWVNISPNDPLAFADEALALAHRLAESGRLGNATAVLHDGLAALRRTNTQSLDRIERLLALWVEVAIADAAPQALDRVLYEICRTGPRSATIAGLEALVYAALAVGAWNERALDLASSIEPFAERSLERLRCSIRVMAARRTSPAREEAVIAELAGWTRESTDPATHAAFCCWLGRLRYRQGRYDEAATLHGESAECAPWLTVRCAALTSQASALMEDFRFDEALETAERALVLARASRHAYGRAQTEVVARAIAYRRAEPISPDLPWIEALANLHVPELEALACLTESAAAWRGGDLDLARSLAVRGRQAWASVGETGGGLLLISALALACDKARDETKEATTLYEQALDCSIPGVGIQVLALVAPRLSSAPLGAERIRALAAQVPESKWGLRIDILSVQESLDRLSTWVSQPAVHVDVMAS
ncbi:MAG: serine/threonine protein kinase [Polyangiaceae bacterium]|nr:serine/threonine protein kinase [Polyangiaceae bacterium]